MILLDPWLVVPGVRLGNVALADPVAVLQKLGEPTTGDAAMQKSWSTWIGKGGGRLDAFVMNDRAGGPTARRTIHVLRATSARFHLADGLHPGSSARSLRRAFPGARKAGAYGSAAGRVAFWDDVRRGLAWEASPGGRVLALIVHRAGEPLSGSTGPYVSSPLPQG